jgi:hypothetical protein
LRIGYGPRPDYLREALEHVNAVLEEIQSTQPAM